MEPNYFSNFPNASELPINEIRLFFGAQPTPPVPAARPTATAARDDGDGGGAAGLMVALAVLGVVVGGGVRGGAGGETAEGS